MAKEIPYYYIDPVVLLELFVKRPKYKKDCERFLYKYGENSKISILGLGEITDTFFEEGKVDDISEAILEFNNIINQNLIKLCSFNFDTMELAIKIFNSLDRDDRDKPADIFHIATAITNKCRFFITLGDKNIIRNQKLKSIVKKYRLEILEVEIKKK